MSHARALTIGPMNPFIIKSIAIVGLLVVLLPAVRPVKISLLPDRSSGLRTFVFQSIGVLLRSERGETISVLSLYQDSQPTTSVGDFTLPEGITAKEITSLRFVGLAATMSISLTIPFSTLQDAIDGDHELVLRYDRASLTPFQGARCLMDHLL